MDSSRKKLRVVGDRVLISPELGEGRTRVGLYLPAAAVEKMAVQSGTVVEVGPGTPVPNPKDVDDEPWKTTESDGHRHYIPMEARIGDVALFLRNAAVEIEYEDDKYLIVPHSAILLLISPETAREGEFREEDFKL